MGIWRYNTSFLLSIGQYFNTGENNAQRLLGHEKTEELTNVTKSGALPGARSNAVLNRRWAVGLLLPEDFDREVYASRVLEVLQTRLLHEHSSTGLNDSKKGLETMQTLIRDQYGFDVRLQLLLNFLKFWTSQRQTPRQPRSHEPTSAGSTTQQTPDLYRGRNPDPRKKYDAGGGGGGDVEAEESVYDGDTLAEVDIYPGNHDERQSRRTLARYSSDEARPEYQGSTSDTDDAASMVSAATQVAVNAESPAFVDSNAKHSHSAPN